ncbi:tyrosine-protein phosphatase [Lentilactobacillus parakefiri]|uniref:Protein tyrosine phosphatase n=1 Tax=Lentilactobacillus parakefiri TaxID=152332 RepID=A0A269YC68_9LACO|nr:tyrosine-protein phosphatase [Lentilactobacillus parakefiri]PAK83069.1 protein tyrosine phosphatase [Lentilactobacillus parakefiri]
MKSLRQIIDRTLLITTILTGSFMVCSAKRTSSSGSIIHFSTIPNARDLGGIQTKNGQHIRRNRLIRSAALSRLTHHGQWLLTKQHRVTVILDFRSTGEIKRAPDLRKSGVRHIHLPIMKEPYFGVHTTSRYAKQLATKQPNFMEQFYQKLILDPHCIKGYRTMFHYLRIQKSGAILYHCTYGKDRTGVATMLILSSLGVPKATIMKNYLVSNRYLKKTTAKEYRRMKRYTHSKTVLRNLKRSKRASPAYLNAAYSAIDRHDGTMKHYLHHQMRLSSHDIQQLRKRYLTK